MASFDPLELFPGRTLASITDAEWIRAVSRLGLPMYLEKQRYGQFCQVAKHPPDWTLFGMLHAGTQRSG